ncbi:MAG: transcription-repair coupling factor [Caldimicrobium sp.]|nr:transcription-repair coupling factor [Caldimicrobium sp.]MCX7872823.1 transcription-repair coupling factor [Caldimicrobium sp.]MDW8093598.1 transcription-repair coupling factor [Caldimicrobium sp.]
MRFVGVNPSFLGYLLAKDYENLIGKRHLLAIFPEQEQAKDFLQSFRIFSKDTTLKTALYPSFDLPPFSESISLDEGERERLKILWELTETSIIAFEIRSFFRKTIRREDLKNAYLYLVLGEKIDRESFIEDLLLLGYERVGVVKSSGEFTVKGAVLDLFSPQYSYPIRIEFFGQEITNLKFFDPLSQRSVGYTQEAIILPAKELFFPRDIQRIYKNILSFRGRISELRISQLIQMIESKVILENPEFLLPLVFQDLILVPENFSASERAFLIYEKETLEKKIDALWDRLYHHAMKARAREKLIFEEEKLYATKEEIKSLWKQGYTIEASELPVKEKFSESFSLTKIDLNWKSAKTSIDIAFDYLINMLEEGYRIYVAISDEKNRDAMLDGLKYRGITALENLKFVKGELREGFVYERERLLLTSDFELFGKRSLKGGSYKVQGKSKGYFRRYDELKPGDFVVHKTYGIGRFQGLVFLKVDSFEGEFLQVEYLGGDRLYLPVTRLNELYPYIGVEDKEPQLDKLGKLTFLKKRKEVEKRLTEVVEEILRLYAERKTIKSYSLPFPGLAYAQFANSFPYEETPDQLSAIQDVIEDLTSPKAMERLVVGDVGFGKTEVALRAIFITAYAGKQAAVLTPTTLLAEQHYRNFKERLEPFNIKVGILSRLRSEREMRETLQGIREGTIKVIIGTHRLLSKDVIFNDLGLLVIDEEHKFGVKQKERLKQFKKSVKVLSLSATPIPRSLQLSLLGIFDLSLIETPPLGRKTIKTVLAKFDSELIKTAIEEELSRGGQIYFVHPRIQGLATLAQYLKRLVPQARVEMIHGQMEEERLEKVLYKFLNKEIDLLVCTPIIGSGIDVPTANTIFINRADIFGLADLYQLRGRVGRGNEQAYCYLLVPDLKTISEGAQKRLKALMQFVEIGSGFRLSLSDLKIRGAGELLGINQSGHINKVGYELYLELLENTIRQLKGEKIETWEPEIKLKLSAYIPPSYIPETEERLNLYRELVLLSSLEELEDFQAFLLDKYGPIPLEVENLLRIQRLKLFMKDLRIFSVEEKGKAVQLMLGNLELLPSLKKLSRFNSIEIFKVKEDKDRAYVYLNLKGNERPLDLLLKVCDYLSGL